MLLSFLSKATRYYIVQVLEWFHVELRLPYMPSSHGSIPEWLLSIVFVHLQVGDDQVWFGFQSTEALGKAAEQFALHAMVRACLRILFMLNSLCASQSCLFNSNRYCMSTNFRKLD